MCTLSRDSLRSAAPVLGAPPQEPPHLPQALSLHRHPGHAADSAAGFSLKFLQPFLENNVISFPPPSPWGLEQLQMND